ncbi:MAG: UbiD family decarboxylase [Nitrosopumilaceae archaeon]
MEADLRTYLAQIAKSDDLAVIKKKVSTKYDVAAITAKLDRSKAALFENVKESKFRIVTNLVGTKSRFARAVGATASTINDKIISSIKKATKPRIVTKGKFMENRSKNLSLLPIVTHFDKEPGPFITSSVVYTENQETKSQNSSFHRLLPLDKKHFSIRMVEGRHLHKSFIYAKEHGEDLKVAITVGVHPAISIAGAYQAEWGKDEIEIANSILGKKLTLTKCPYSGMYVPSKAEIVMEGRILKDKTYKEWMVEMLRTYDFKRKQPVFELESLYYRDNPVFHDILSGYSEHRLLMGLPIEAKLNRNVKRDVPQTMQVVLTDGGCNWLHAVVQISKKNNSDPKKAIKSAFATHRSLKSVVIVDDDIDPHDPVAVEYAMATRFQADKDLIVIKKVRGSSLDPSSDQKNLLTAKMGIDATQSFSKPREVFEIAKVPKEDKISLKDYVS